MHLEKAEVIERETALATVEQALLHAHDYYKLWPRNVYITNKPLSIAGVYHGLWYVEY